MPGEEKPGKIMADLEQWFSTTSVERKQTLMFTDTTKICPEQKDTLENFVADPIKNPGFISHIRECPKCREITLNLIKNIGK
jgi:hypothetical protein